MTLNLDSKEELPPRDGQANCYEIDSDKDEMLLDELDVFEEHTNCYPNIEPLRFSEVEAADHFEAIPLQNSLFMFTESDEEEQTLNRQLKFQMKGVECYHSGFVYKDLIFKLELALRKILEGKTVHHRAKTEISSDKQEEQKKRKLSDLYEVPEEMYQTHVQKAKNKSMTTSTTFAGKGHREPFHPRTGLHSDRVKLKTETDPKTSGIKSETVFPDQITEFTSRKYELQRKTKQFLQNMVSWKEKKDRRNQQRIEKKQEVLKTEATFVPTINVKSKQLMKKKGEAVPIFERLVRSKKSENSQPESHKK